MPIQNLRFPQKTHCAPKFQFCVSGRCIFRTARVKRPPIQRRRVAKFSTSSLHPLKPVLKTLKAGPRPSLWKSKKPALGATWDVLRTGFWYVRIFTASKIGAQILARGIALPSLFTHNKSLCEWDQAMGHNYSAPLTNLVCSARVEWKGGGGEGGNVSDSRGGGGGGKREGGGGEAGPTIARWP